jgi:hypothetical protein
MIKAYQILWKRLTKTGSVKPKLHILDNKASIELNTAIKKNCTIQLVPPDNHRRNLAKRAIQTFKNHIEAIIQGVDNSFPMNMWDKLLPQMTLTLNLLQQSNTVQTISVYQYVCGSFDYNKMPLTPLGCTVQMHKAPPKQATWAKTQSTDGTSECPQSTTNAT